MKFNRKIPTAGQVGYHPVHMMRKANDPNDDFPAAVKIGPNAIAFVEEEIEAWMQRRIDERLQKNVGEQSKSENGDQLHEEQSKPEADEQSRLEVGDQLHEGGGNVSRRRRNAPGVGWRE